MMIGDIWLTRQMIPELSAKLGVHRRTVARWLEKCELPKTVEMLLSITRNGNLCHIHPDWEGWNIDIKSGELVTPIVYRGRRRTYRHSDIFNVQLMFQLLSALRCTRTQLEAENEAQRRQIDRLLTQIDEQTRLVDVLESKLVATASHKVMLIKSGGGSVSNRESYAKCSLKN